MTHDPRFPVPRRFGAAPVLAAALAATVALPALAEDEGTDVRLRQVDVRRVMVAGDDGAPAGLFISRIAEDGGEPITRLQVLGAGETELDLDSLAVGETRSIQLDDGRWLDVTREETSLTIDLDGKEISVPLNPSTDDLAGLAGGGDHEVRVVMMGDGAHGDGGHFVFHGDGGNVVRLHGDEGMTWTDEDGAMRRHGKVVIKTIGGEDGEDGDFRILTLPAFALSGLPVTDEQLEGLESLEGADPATRAKVLEALKELLARHSAVDLGKEPRVERRLQVR